jgi:hypothetical protein
MVCPPVKSKSPSFLAMNLEISSAISSSDLSKQSTKSDKATKTVGAGGGFISVPFMTWCNVTIRSAVATSASLGFPIAVANVVGYAISGQTVQDLPAGAFGYIWLPALGVIALCSVMTAPMGARAAHNIPVGKLKRMFAFGYVVPAGGLHALQRPERLSDSDQAVLGAAMTTMPSSSAYSQSPGCTHTP